MKNIPLGLYSARLAALVWVGLCAGIVALRLAGSYFFFKNETGILLMTCWFFGGLGISLIGVGLAVAGLIQVDRRKLSAVLGLVFNSLILLAGCGVYCLSR